MKKIKEFGSVLKATDTETTSLDADVPANSRVAVNKATEPCERASEVLRRCPPVAATANIEEATTNVVAAATGKT